MSNMIPRCIDEHCFSLPEYGVVRVGISWDGPLGADATRTLVGAMAPSVCVQVQAAQAAYSKGVFAGTLRFDGSERDATVLSLSVKLAIGNKHVSIGPHITAGGRVVTDMLVVHVHTPYRDIAIECQLYPYASCE